MVEKKKVSRRAQSPQMRPQGDGSRKATPVGSQKKTGESQIGPRLTREKGGGKKNDKTIKPGGRRI